MSSRNVTRRPALAALAVLWAGGVARAETLDDVLGRMDTAAKQFRSYSANVKQVRYGSALGTYDDSSGVMRTKRAKNGVAGIFDETAGPDRTIYHFDGPTAEVYLPKANTLERYKTKKYASTIDQLLLLGFAVTRDEIKRDYDSKLTGAESVDGATASHIVLTPKSAEAQKTLKTVDLWIDPKGNAVREKWTEPNGGYRQVTFSEVKVNPDLPDSAFDLKTPPGTKIVNEN